MRVAGYMGLSTCMLPLARIFFLPCLYKLFMLPRQSLAHDVIYVTHVVIYVTHDVIYLTHDVG